MGIYVCMPMVMEVCVRVCVELVLSRGGEGGGGRKKEERERQQEQGIGEIIEGKINGRLISLEGKKKGKRERERDQVDEQSAEACCCERLEKRHGSCEHAEYRGGDV